MTTVFYAPPEAFHGDRVVLPEAEARHATKVLRLREGAGIVLVDGRGGRHTVQLTRTAPGAAEGEVVATERAAPPPPLTLALGLLKADERFAFALEKAAELGVTRFVPLRTARVEAHRVRLDRLRAHAVAAMKQSLRAHLMDVTEAQPLEAVAGPGAVLLHEAAPLADSLPALIARAGPPATLIVGPEGGFSDGEIERARASGTRVASLGAVRLRAETAAVVAAAAVYLSRTDAP